MIAKFLKSLLSFAFVSIVTYTILVIIWGFIAPDLLRNNLRNPEAGSFLHKRLAEVKEVEDLDILFLGPSTTYMGFDSRIFRDAGYENFNLGSGAQTPKQTRILLKRYIDQLKPDLVVYELFPVMLESSGISSTHDLIYHDKVDLPLMKLIFETKSNIKIINAILFHGFIEITSVDANLNFPYTKNRKYIPGGYVELPMTYNKMERVDEFTGVNRELQLREDQLKALDDNLSMLRERNIPFILLRAPITSYEYDSFQNNNEIDSIFSSKGAYYNFQKRIFLSDSLNFHDEHHLNQAGVERFNDELLEIISVILK